MSLPSFLLSFLGENSQLSILTVISKFYIVFPPLPHSASTLAKTIMAVRYMLVSFQTLMSALRILTTEARGKSLVQTPQCRKMHNEI